MNAPQDRPIPWLGRAFVACIVLGSGVLAAVPFRRESPPPIIPRGRIASDSVRLVFRNQDITLQMHPHQEASPAELPAATSDENAERSKEQFTPQLPELPSQYRSLLDPHSTTPKSSLTPHPGRLLEPVTPAPAPLREHVLVDGDSLERLAERYLGDADRAEEILAVNREVLSDPQTLPLGKVIRIPAREK